MTQPNPFLEILDREGPEALVRALETEPHPTPALKAAIYALKVYAVVPFA